MSTRTNVIIKKGEEIQQMYHHHDGYPSGVGAEITDILNKVNDTDKSILKSISKLTKKFNEYDSGFEIEGKYLNLHGDIEYLYVIDLEKEIVNCYSVDMWNCPFGVDTKLVFEGIVPEDDELIYSLPMLEKYIKKEN